MASSIWTIEYFSCPSCGLPYTATREHHPDKHSGKFKCEVCETKVHEWSGNYDFFDWKVDVVKSPVFGKRWSTTALRSLRRPAITGHQENRSGGGLEARSVAFHGI